jgi:hypothetical protein
MTRKTKKNQKGEKLDDHPCAALAKLSYKCLRENNYNHDRCTKQFEVYRLCRQQEKKRLHEQRQNNGTSLFG